MAPDPHAEPLRAGHARSDIGRSTLSAEAKVAVGFLAAFLVIATFAWTGYRTARACHISYIVKPLDFNNFSEAVARLGLYWIAMYKTAV